MVGTATVDLPLVPCIQLRQASYHGTCTTNYVCVPRTSTMVVMCHRGPAPVPRWYRACMQRSSGYWGIGHSVGSARAAIPSAWPPSRRQNSKKTSSRTTTNYFGKGASKNKFAFVSPNFSVFWRTGWRAGMAGRDGRAGRADHDLQLSHLPTPRHSQDSQDCRICRTAALAANALHALATCAPQLACNVWYHSIYYGKPNQAGPLPFPPSEQCRCPRQKR